MAVLVAGVSASAFEQERIESLRPGDHIDIAGYTLTLREVRRVPGPNYVADEAVIEVKRGGAVIDEMHPQRRTFTVQRQTTALTAIRTGLSADLYLALGEGDAQAGWVVRAWHKPIVSWIWLGALVMALGGVVSLTDRRWRVGVAARKPVAPASIQSAAAE
jgi:cytochrome c-type biogenesis protein CcmF